ncbi:MAG: NTP transferase domain-containing protein [Chloroflexi bacterium]|nr:NTP transferase domain-containing protein [Chloroflexota bacterium]
MKVVIPMAGYGTRLRPHTYSRPKPLVNVAGQPLIKHVIDSLDELEIDEYIFIVGYLGDQIEAYIRDNHDIKAHFVVQEEMLGQSHAIHLAKEYLQGPAVVLFSDTIFKADLSPIQDTDKDGVIYAMEVDDPSSFGVIVVNDDGIITDFIEKPDTDKHRSAVVGLYYLRESERLIAAIEEQIESDKQTKGEYYIADAFQIMIDDGARLISAPVEFWLDCGKPDTLLATNRFLLENGAATNGEHKGSGTTIISPVHIHPDAVIENAIIGPHATISAGCHISNSVIRNSIINEGARVQNVMLSQSLVGQDASVSGHFKTLNVGDKSSIDFD